MSQHKRSYREVIPDQTQPDTWREITLNTGGTQSTLQDIKVAERANGYCYVDSSKYFTRNRFIYWRINHDILEIVEQSLDVNLSGNKIRFRFIDTPILDGITIYETLDNVIILVPTICSVHRLTFPHPLVLHIHDELVGSHPDLTVASIFAEASVIEARDPSTFIVFDNPVTANALPHVANSILTIDEEAIFILGYPTGETLLVRQASNGQSLQSELKHDSFMPRFISGIAEKFRSKFNDGNVVTSILLHSFGPETYGLTLSRDGNLRVWNCSNGHCIASTDILSETTEGGRNLIQGTQNHLLRKSISSNNEVTLVIFMSFAIQNMFHVFKPTINGGQFRIVRINSLYSPGRDLVDFNLTQTRIWSLWRGEDGEATMYTAALCRAGSEGSHWMPVTLEPLPDADATPDTAYVAPREAYLKHLFYPGRFPLHVISKALSIYTKTSLLSDIGLSSAVLKQRVCLAIDKEIYAELKEDEISDEDYLQCSNWCWSRFYSCCVQYHVVGLKLLGLVILPNVEGVVLLKKSMFSLIRPLDALEHLMLCPDYSTVMQFPDNPVLSEDLDITEDVIKLMLVIVYLDQQLSDMFKNIFEKELSQLRLPDIIMSELISEILTNMDEEFTAVIAQKLSDCKDIYQAMHKILELLRVENYCLLSNDSDQSESFNKQLTSLNHIFSSSLGVSFVTQSISQQAAVRFSVCRNLLVIQNILLERGEHEWNALEAVRSVCLPEIVVLTQASFATMYLTTLAAASYLPLEDMMQRLVPLKLNPVFNLKLNNKKTISLMDLFINSTGGFEAHKLLLKLQTGKISSNWNVSLLPYLDIVTHLIWPISDSTVFEEWLLSSGQHVWLQHHVRLLNNWCEWNNCTRNFLLGVSLITSGEFFKAENLFLEAQKGIYTENFFHKRIEVSANLENQKSSSVNYYLKVIQLFELHGAKDSAINIASRALTIADRHDPHIATLYSIKFVHHLALNRYDEAYASLNANPDSERAKDNLRDLVKTLLDTKQIDKLLSLPYSGFEEHLVNIILIRARATDTINNVYYDVLYSYQIKRGPKFMRFAAAVMYEQAFRLILYDSVDALEKQVKCYLAAINALCLCEQKFAWVARPADPNIKETTVIFPKLAGSSQTEEPQVFSIKQDEDVLTVDDIRKELELASAKLRLARRDPPILTNYYTNPSELVVVLTSAGIFKYALLLCSKFDLPYDLTFQVLTKQCIFLQETEDQNAWSWLIENDLHDLPIISSSPSIVAWNLLESYLEQYEETGMTVIHKVVCQKIISMEGYVPHWILASYKKRNPAELLRLFFFNGRLEEAVALAGEYILAGLGHGKEHFGFTHMLVATAPAFCIAVNTIESLLYELELQNQADPEKPLEKEYNYLKDLLINYLDTSTRISTEMCRFRMSQVV